MKTRAMRRVAARDTWARLSVSFWFAPALFALAAVLLAWTMYGLDERVPNEALANSPFILTGSVAELRGYLLSMAGTVLATAGVVFTLLTLPLSTVVAQYGSRLLRVFLGDRTTQLVLAMFVGTFVYCIAAAMSIPAVDVQPEGPQLTATVGLLLLLATFASLILLTQHISTMLQAPNIAAGAGAQLLAIVGAEIPGAVRSAEPQRQAGQGAPNLLPEGDGLPLRVSDHGYIQTVDPDYILTLAHEQDLVVRLVRKPGHFVWSNEVVALVWPADRIDERLERQIRRAFRLGNQRTPTQDVECAVNHLVEMAVRAMSPAINDPFTAMTCLDYLGNGLSLIAQQGEEDVNIFDQDGRLRLVFEPVTFDVLLNAAFDMLRHASCDNATVLLHMLAVIAAIGRGTAAFEARQMLLRHVNLILAESQAGALIEEDRRAIQQRGEALRQTLAVASGTPPGAPPSRPPA